MKRGEKNGMAGIQIFFFHIKGIKILTTVDRIKKTGILILLKMITNRKLKIVTYQTLETVGMEV